MKLKITSLKNTIKPEDAAARDCLFKQWQFDRGAGTMLQQENKGYHKMFMWIGYAFAYANKGLEILSFVDQIGKLGRENQKNFLRYGISFIRECCLLMAGAGNLVHLPAQELETAQRMTNVMNIEQGPGHQRRAGKSHIITWKEMLTLKFYF